LFSVFWSKICSYKTNDYGIVCSHNNINKDNLDKYNGLFYQFNIIVLNFYNNSIESSEITLFSIAID